MNPSFNSEHAMDSRAMDMDVPNSFKRILLVHNRYKIGGGEDSVFETEREMLISMGHQVESLEFYNSETASIPKWKAAIESIWSSSAKSAVSLKIKSFMPNIVHFHNTFLRVSPSAYYACREARIPCVQTLHNYRLLCLNGLFLRDNKPCEDCLERRVPWPGVLHKCYHSSTSDSCLVASIQMTHNFLGTYSDKVDAFIALTGFAKDKFVRGGLPATKLHVKPNFVEDIGEGLHLGRFCLFVGRLSHEKGVNILIEAWKHLGMDIPLKIVGTGPLEVLRSTAPTGVEYLGHKSREEVFQLMRNATLAIIPSIWYEGFPVVIPEAFAAGLPIIASQIGTLGEVLHNEDAGWLFKPADSESLAHTVRIAWNATNDLLRKGKAARIRYETQFSPKANYLMLREVYAAAKLTASRIQS